MQHLLIYGKPCTDQQSNTQRQIRSKVICHFIGMLRMKKGHSVNLESHEERLIDNIIACRLVRD